MPGIQFRLSLLGVAPAGLIGLVLALYFIQTRIADLDRNLGMRGDLIVRQLAAASVSPVASGNLAVLRSLADAALEEKDVIEVDVFDRQGRALVLRDNVSANCAEAPADCVVETAPILPKPMPGHLALSRGPDTVPQPVLASAEALGSVRLVLSRQGTFRQQRDTVAFSLLLLLGGLAGAALLARRMASKISEPVMALTIAVHELSKGNMDARAESEAEAELAYLQAGFNAMAAELKKDRDFLEHQVRQATCRLQEALDALEKRNGELEAARWSAEAQTELKSRFLAQMSHEIRTPMNGIIGFAELLAKSPLHEDQAEKLGLITRSAKNLLSIINDILDLAKLEAGKISLDTQAFALRPCLEDIVSLLSVRVTPSAIALWIHPGVPEAIVGDPVRLQQVVANLLGNALKFTLRGRIVIRVRALRGEGGGRLMFSVSDSGSGISPQDMTKLFSPFLQLGEYASLSEKGTGLGLSISKNIVESMGGEIHLVSRLGKGTSLWFDLPLVGADAPGDVPALQGVVGVVEANRIFRLALKDQLQNLGARVEAFASAQDLIRRFESGGHPDVVMYGLWPKREKEDAALPRWLEWCESRQVRPILLFPGGERRLVGFYRKRGLACLFHPVRSETLVKAIAAPETASVPNLPVVEPMPAQTAHPGLRILVADDNEINRLLLRAQLERFQAEIVEVADGREALARLRQQRYDLIFLDLQMPLLDGPQVLRELRGNPGPNRHVQAVAITAFGVPGQREESIRGGFSDCLIKPILEEHLAQLIDARLSVERRRPVRRERPGRLAGAEDHLAAIMEKTGGRRELAEVVVRKLFEELPEDLRQTGVALGQRERETARLAVHKINGSASFSGLPGIRQAAASLESALGRGESWESLGGLHQALVREVEGFMAQESAILGRLAPQPDGQS